MPAYLRAVESVGRIAQSADGPRDGADVALPRPEDRERHLRAVHHAEEEAGSDPQLRTRMGIG